MEASALRQSGADRKMRIILPRASLSQDLPMKSFFSSTHLSDLAYLIGSAGVRSLDPGTRGQDTVVFLAQVLATKTLQHLYMLSLGLL